MNVKEAEKLMALADARLGVAKDTGWYVGMLAALAVDDYQET